VAEIAAHHKVQATHAIAWKAQLLESPSGLFCGETVAADERDKIRELHKLIIVKLRILGS
jgi:hypothetical protein